MKKFNEVENMMLNIIDYGQQQVFNDIEAVNDAVRRYNQRHTFFEAIEKLNIQGKEKLS